MKELDVFIRSEHRSKVTDILQKNRAGISFFEVLGTGSTPSAAPEVASEHYGVLFVKDVTEAYQFGTKVVGEEILTPK